MVLAGLIASLKLLGGSLADHTFLFLGAGEVSFYLFNKFAVPSTWVVFAEQDLQTKWCKKSFQLTGSMMI